MLCESDTALHVGDNPDRIRLMYLHLRESIQRLRATVMQRECWHWPATVHWQPSARGALSQW